MGPKALLGGKPCVLLTKHPPAFVFDIPMLTNLLDNRLAEHVGLFSLPLPVKFSWLP